MTEKACNVVVLSLVGAVCLTVIACTERKEPEPPPVSASVASTESQITADLPKPPTLAPGTKYTRTTTTTTEPGREKTIERAAGAGGKMHGDGDKVDIKSFDSSVPSAGLTDLGSATGGGLKGSLSASLADAPWFRWMLLVVGIIMVIMGAVALKLGQPIKAALGTAVIGAGLIACFFSSAFSGFILLAVSLYAAGSLWLTGDSVRRFREALRAQSAGISELSKTEPAAFTKLTSLDPKVGLIVAHAEGSDMPTLAAIKKADDLN